MVKQFLSYLQESQRELKKVVWPSHQEVTRHTIVVVVFCICLALFIALFDFVLRQGLLLLA